MTQRRTPRRSEGPGGDGSGNGKQPERRGTPARRGQAERRTPSRPAPSRRSEQGPSEQGRGQSGRSRQQANDGQRSGQKSSQRAGQQRTSQQRTRQTERVRREEARKARLKAQKKNERRARREQRRRARRARPPRRLRLGRPHRRLQVAFVLVAMLASVFAGRLFQLQAVDAAEFADRASSERLREVTLQASRGDVTDTNGVPLATTVDAVAVTADPSMTRSQAPQIADVLSPLLEKNRDELVKKLTEPDSRFEYLARKVMPNVWKQANERLQDKGLTGVFMESDPLRTYPSSSVAAATLGFVGSDGHGLGGLEYSLDDKLAGKNGQATYEIGAKGQQIPLATSTEQEPRPGKDIRLTLDRDVQWYAQQRIAEEVEKRGAESGDVVVMDAKTQRVVAMATAPTFDANDATKTSPDQRRNRPAQDTFEPGSVAKAFTAASLLDGGYVDPQTKISTPGSLTRSGQTIGDHWDHGRINLTFAGAIAQSSNIATTLANERMPAEEQERYLRKFGLGSKPMLGVPAGAKGSLPSGEWSDLTRSTLAFGQGMSVSSIQMASGLATIANGGKRVEPSLVKGHVDGGGNLQPAPRGKTSRVVSEKSAKTVSEIMEQVTAEGGFAEDANIPGYRVAGKTGTAQRIDPDCGCYRGYTASFGGFAPANNPRFVVYVAVHDPEGDTTGSGVAAPVFHDTLGFALRKYRVPTSHSKPPKLEQEW